MLGPKAHVLRNIDFLKDLPEETLLELSQECQYRTLEIGDTLFDDGDESNAMFIVLSGELVVTKNALNIARRAAGEYIGEMALIESQPRSATVKASARSELMEITQTQFQEKLASNPDVLMAIMKTLSGRARENLRILHKPDNDVSPLGAHPDIENLLTHLLQETGLTKREAEVAALLCEGLSDKLIAKKLGISPFTIRDHLKKIYAKFQVNARSELVMAIYK